MDWIERIKSDPNKALTTLYDDLQHEAIRWIIREFNLNREDAVEIFHVSLVLLYDNVITGKLVSLTAGIKTYLYAIIKNKVYQYRRVSSKISSFDSVEILRDTLDEEYSEISKVDLDKAASSIIKLGEPCKTLLELSFYQLMKMDDITLLMGYKNNDTTKNLKYKCLKRLQKIFFE